MIKPILLIRIQTMSRIFNVFVQKKWLLSFVMTFCFINVHAQLPYFPLGPNGYYPGDRQIATYDSSVYSIGHVGKGLDNYAGYWKDNEFKCVNEKNSFAYGICVNKDDVYIVGCITKNDGYYPALWKNGEHIEFSQSLGVANSIMVVDSNIYIAGITL
jgi:hypothetical protein